FGVYVVVMAFSAVGLLLYGVERLRARLNWRQAVASRDLFKDALVMPPLIYLGFCLINFQSGPDLIPFFPFVGIFAGWLLVRACQAVAASRWPKLNARSIRALNFAPHLALIIIIFLVIIRALSYSTLRTGTLQDQKREAAVIAGLLGPNDSLY